MHIHGLSLILIALLVQSLSQVCLCTNSSFVCVERERRALLKFKQSFSGSTRRLSSWQGKHCCQWVGIGCDTLTGHVTKLNLRFDEAFERRNLSRRLHAREVDSSLKKLEDLRYLDVRGNDFGGSNIPAFFGSMTRLKFLGLSLANFTGLIPHELGSLTELRALHLMSDNDGLHVDSLEWVSNLVSLRYLDMSYLNMSNVANTYTIMKVLSTLPWLSHLSFAGCNLGNTPFTKLEYLRNMTTLRLLDLSFNSLNFSITPFVRSFESLFHLDLSSNGFDIIESGGLLSILDNACYLKLLDVSGNPSLLSNYEYHNGSSYCAKYDLEFLDLSMSELSGPLPDWLEKLEFLKHLDLRLNSFVGPIPPSIGVLSSLVVLDLSYNQLNGSIPETLGDLLSLSELNLSNNNLSGDVPTSLGNLRNLEVLDVTHNSLEGYVSEVHLANLSKLRTLDVSFNLNLIFKTRSIWVHSFQLHYIYTTSCKFGSRFPQWLRTQKEVIGLGLSDGDIDEKFPDWLHDMTNLAWLDLSGNKINGRFPQTFLLLCRI